MKHRVHDTAPGNIIVNKLSQSSNVRIRAIFAVCTARCSISQSIMQLVSRHMSV